MKKNTQAPRAKRIAASAFLRSFGINYAGGMAMKRYMARLPSANFDPEMRRWTVLDNEPDPRRPAGRPKTKET